mgnify:CR=1 FL=1
MRVGLIGLNNFGKVHFDALRRLNDSGELTFAAACTRNFKGLDPMVLYFEKHGIPTYTDYQIMLKEQLLDICAISTGIHLHKPMSLEAMAAGANVYCEKPPAPTCADVQEMIDCASRLNKICVIGFNWQAGPSLHFILDRIFNDGRLGRVKKVQLLLLTNRGESYFNRTEWAGKRFFNGIAINDGTINNPFAHTIAYALQFAADSYGGSAAPVEVMSDMYRLRDIETEDTTSLVIKTDTGVEIRVNASTAAEPGTDIRLAKITCENGVIAWDNRTTVTVTSGGDR